jgi:putative phosphoesterase
MLLGLLSDTHDRLRNASEGIRLLQDGGAEFFIHCGDVGSEQIIDLLAGLKAALVWGNNDWDRKSLTRYAQHLGIKVLEPGGELELDGKLAAVAHGDDAHVLKRIIMQQRHDYVFVGHSHQRTDKHFDKVRLINPGALHRANPKSVALLDTASDELRYLMLDE